MSTITFGVEVHCKRAGKQESKKQQTKRMTGGQRGMRIGGPKNIDATGWNMQQDKQKNKERNG